MGSGEINVAYDGTFGDLGALSTDATMFSVNDTFDFNSFIDGGDMHATDGFTAINNGSMNSGTISPKDVFNNTDSLPPSTAFTNLTTPGSTFIETPDDDYQTSPLFGDNLMESQGADHWFSLFPDSDNSATAGATQAPVMARTTSASSGNQIMVHPGGELNRKRSPPNASPAMYSPAIKHSSVAGVNARKRDKPLPPIVVEEGDSIALKRARNTAAARKSRAKKVAERDDLESEIADLKAQVEHWKSMALGQATKSEPSDE